MSKIYLNNIRFIHYMKIYRDGIINMANVILFAILDTKGEADMSIIKAKEYLKSVGYEDRVMNLQNQQRLWQKQQRLLVWNRQ